MQVIGEGSMVARPSVVQLVPSIVSCLYYSELNKQVCSTLLKIDLLGAVQCVKVSFAMASLPVCTVW